MTERPDAKSDVPDAELFALGPKGDEIEALALSTVDNPLGDRSFGAFGPAVVVEALPSPAALLRLRLPEPMSVGIAPDSVRLFLLAGGDRPEPIWASGYTAGVGLAWGLIRQPGTYVAIGLPRDQLLSEALRQIAVDRRLGTDLSELSDARRRSKASISSLLDGPPEDVTELRRFLTSLELETGVEQPQPWVMEQFTGGHLIAFRLPGALSLEEFRRKAASLEITENGLPEEELFFPPDAISAAAPPWSLAADRLDWDGVDPIRLDRIESILGRLSSFDWLRPFPWPWLRSKNWWMHQHDQRHTGHASGASDITRTTVNRMRLQRMLAVDGPVISKPAIVDGSIYIGSGRQGGSGGTLYKFDLATGTKQGEYPTSGSAFYGWFNGIGGTPAVAGGRVYFTGVHGKVYCLDTATMSPVAPYPAPIWETDLDVPSVAQNQPVSQPNADCWSGPLVVGNRVYVGCGEGEDANTYGFIYCLDATSGRVNWLFCTAKFSGAGNNAPNVIPTAVAASWASAAGFTVAPNPAESGSAVWSSCAYDSVLDRIYVGTGNSQYDFGAPGLGTALPDQLYGSGLIALDAATGAFRGFFQPAPDDSYWPGDYDIDVPGAPTVINRGADRVVAFGSKNGSLFLLDPQTLAPVARRQLLPRTGGTGVPGNRGNGVASIVPTGGSGENSYGVFGTPAVHFGRQRLFVGLGGYNGMALDAGAGGIDATRTPFVRAVDWNTLLDAWPTAVGADGISRYTIARPPLYLSREVGLSSPAVVNDVVFVSTDKAAMYALDVDTGLCLWSAPGLPSTGSKFALGPAIYGNYVVVGAGSNVYVYRLWSRFWPPVFPRPPIYEIVRYPWPPVPPPPPDPWRVSDVGPLGDRGTLTPQFVLLLTFGVAVVAAVLIIGLAALVIR